MRSLVHSCLRSCSEVPCLAGCLKQLVAYRQGLRFHQQRVPTSIQSAGFPHSRRSMTTMMSREISQFPIEGKMDRLVQKGQKSGLTIEISEHDQATRVTLGDLVKARVPQAPFKFLAAIPIDDQGVPGGPLSLHEPIPKDSKAAIFLSFDSEAPAGRQAFWNTSAYLLGAALLELHGNDKCLLAGSPKLLESTAGGSGYSYEYLLRSADDAADGISHTYTDAVKVVNRLIASQSAQSTPAASQDLERLEQIMVRIIAEHPSLKVQVLNKSDALQVFRHNPFKIERILSSSEDTVKTIRIGQNFVDVATSGLLIPDLRAIKAIKLVDWSTATFVPSNPSHPATELPKVQQLHSLRAVSFPHEKQLKEHIRALEEAAQSSHQAIGTSQSLFLNHQSSPGTPFMLPHGVRLARKMERVIRDLYDVHEYDEVISPQLFKKGMWVRSGHWQNYRDDMFSVEGFKEKESREAQLFQMTSTEREGCCAAHTAPSSTLVDDSFGLKPMNCPGHCIIFASQPRSVKELPIRYAEWSPLHRNESSGSLSGLTRVRRFHQDDAHVFCAQSQVASEISTMLQMLSEAYNVFGFPSFELALSTRPANYIGSIDEWDRAEQSLREAMDGTGLKWELNEADGAFYGPKIDVRLIDVLGRKHQTATIQLDFQLPQRFDLSYEDVNEVDGHARPVMIHRAILGSVERFMAILIESQGNRWPFWISPRQALVVPVARTDAVASYAREAQRYLSLGTDFGGLTSTCADTQAQQQHSSASLTSRPRPTQTFHIDLDQSGGTLAKRIRKAHVARYNFTLVVGEQEAANRTVRVRTRFRRAVDDGAKQLQQEEDPARLRRLEAALGTEVDFKEDMGEWRLEDLRRLFCKLDSWHL